jgi:hypothetical protein
MKRFRIGVEASPISTATSSRPRPARPSMSAGWESSAEAPSRIKVATVATRRFFGALDSPRAKRLLVPGFFVALPLPLTLTCSLAKSELSSSSSASSLTESSPDDLYLLDKNSLSSSSTAFFFAEAFAFPASVAAEAALLVVARVARGGMFRLHIELCGFQGVGVACEGWMN